MNLEDILGTWRLVSFKIRHGDKVIHPFGEDAIGYAIMSEEGYVMATVMRADRKNFKSNDLLGGTIEEKASAAETYISYGGRFEITGNKSTTDVEFSLFPNWVGGRQIRFFELEGDRLSISTAPIEMYGEMQSGHLIWDRVKDTR